jgi:ABC-2 type transport system ATP-binding protein
MNKILMVLSLGLALAGCGGGGSAPDSAAQPAAIPSDAPGHNNAIPPSPTLGQSRAGKIYSVYIQAPGTGDTVAFTVFEPATFTGGQTYPLVLHSHGFSQSRRTGTDCQACTIALEQDLAGLVANGYGVISIDERGHGESTGKIRVMDPDYEGKDLLAILDWAEARLDWLRYGPSVDGRDPHNLVLGAVGGSYGGAYQLLINNIDPKHRLDAIVPQYTFYDIPQALFPNGAIKAWSLYLFGAGLTAGSNADRNHFDPFIPQFFQETLLTNAVSAQGYDFFRYHSPSYFCEGLPVASNGAPATVPEHQPVHPPKVHAMFWQGMRDTIFPLNHAWQNAQCLKESGGDVRLLSYQAGHNALQVVPDPGELLFQPPGDFVNNHCGTLDVNTATLAFFDEHLKGVAGAANQVPRTCLSLSGNDAVVVDQVTSGYAGMEKVVPPTTVIAGVLEAPIVVDLGIVAGSQGEVLAGIPQLEVSVQPTVPGTPGEPILFAGIGQMRAGAPGIWDLLDNQIMPLRGTGDFKLALAGVAERLAPGDRIALLLYGGHDQYHITGSLNVAQPTVMPVTVSGKVWVPLLGPLPAAP